MPICGMWDYKARGILKTRLLCTLQPSIRRGLKFGSSICELLTFSVSCFDWSTLYQIYSCLIHNGAEKDTHTSDLMFFFLFFFLFFKFHNCCLQACVKGRKSFPSLPSLPISIFWQVLIFLPSLKI